MKNFEYIQRVETLSNGFFAENFRKPTMFIQTFGCQMNERESEKLNSLLLAMGYLESPSEESADLVLYNTCCVREKAETKIFGKLGSLKSQKRTQPNKIVALCGCMPQRPEVIEEINAHYKHIDIIFGTFNKNSFPKLLYQRLTTGKRAVEILTEHEEESELLENDTTRFLPHKAGITIMHGCNNFCAYCIVPYVRGREKSRKIADILAEITALANDGVKEVMLLGQNVNSYEYGFAELIQQVNEIENIQRIRFMTSHPKDLSDDLIATIKNCEKVCKHLHLPVQSGSSRILQAMNRGYTQEHYLELTNKLKSAIPNITLTTDIIVGFPGETEEDFLQTLETVRLANFAGAFTFLYSKRSGTPAADLTEIIPKSTAKERFDRLVELVNSLQLKHNQNYIGKNVAVMADSATSGRTDGNVLVHFDIDKLETSQVKPGDILSVKIIGCQTFYLKGTVE
ncbi:MAG: tRNA (N6-isopentenyl adenosine(37)-C2)-methylthiotransferase MiaB [Firmicutes bacterium]|nr:tRNA (N6-isopentenyl adenosine(37)-C2)-methylthiotransferase MiaB [Bacillota bacterium]